MNRENTYNRNLLDHARNPRNFGKLAQPTIVREESNPLCGDQIQMEIQLDQDQIVDIRFSGRGCAVSLAAVSMLTEMVKHKTLNQVESLNGEDMLATLGVSIKRSRQKCAFLGLKIFRSAVLGDTDWPSVK
jgi:nitrogen fixation protein NifU and related proteins